MVVEVVVMVVALALVVLMGFTVAGWEAEAEQEEWFHSQSDNRLGSES